MPDGKSVGAGGGRYIDMLAKRDGKWTRALASHSLKICFAY